MERVNVDMFLQNLCIMEQNEELRRKARLLEQENRVLLAELQRKQQEVAAAGAGASAQSASSSQAQGCGGGHSAAAGQKAGKKHK